MQTTLRISTRVQTGGRIEFTDAQLPEGRSVDVIVLVPPAETPERHSITDVLAKVPGHLLFHSAADVDAYLHQERQEWDR